ncbi:MAG: PucR family transcriptional regulator ligand-binding domain-containing protein [Gordonia sp. (in: high G+C Gram-positive bacteria)]
MTVSLRWLLGRHDLGLRLLTPDVSAAPEIDFVVTTELADPTPWLSGGEMVLTTGLGPSGEDPDAYVGRLVAREVSALGFGVGVSVAEVPDTLVAAASQAALALVEVPLPTPFVALARAVADRTAELQHRSTQEAAAAQPRMTRAAVSGGPSALLRELAAACDGAALLTDRQGAVRDSRPVGIDVAVARAVTEQVRAMQGRRHSGAFVSHSPDGSVLTQEIRVAEDVHGYLAVVTRSRTRPTDQVLIGHANSLLALHFERPALRPEAQTALRTAALGLLLTGEAGRSAARTLLASAADADGRIRVVTLLAEPTALETLREVLAGRLAATGRPVFLAQNGAGELVAVLDGAADRTDVRRLGGRLSPGVRRRLRVGVSRARTVDELDVAVDEARAAALAARPGGPLEEAGALAGRALLSTPEGRAALHDVARVVVQPLVDHDDQHGTQLVESLQAYLECHGQWEAAATVLGVHRHTLRSRIGRVEGILDVDLDSATVRAELLLALLSRVKPAP